MNFEQIVEHRARDTIIICEIINLNILFTGNSELLKMSFDPAPLSKTAKYKKITKPLLERKRRARINRCLEELKDLMVGALEVCVFLSNVNI